MPPTSGGFCLAHTTSRFRRGPPLGTINAFLANAEQLVPRKRWCLMTPQQNERRLQADAQRVGLKLVRDRYSFAATGQRRFFIRPVWDARRAVRILPDGGWELVPILAHGRRRGASQLLIEEAEQLLRRWSGPLPCAPARFPWQAANTNTSNQ